MAPRTNEESFTENEGASTVAYTDVPVKVKLLPGGRFEMPSESNVFLHWTAKHIQIPTTDTPLSIRWIRGGQRFFTMQGSRCVVDDNSYLILNSGQQSTTEIDALTSVQCFTVCFRPDTVADVLRSLVTPADRLLEEPRAGSGSPITFVQRTYCHDATLSPLLCRLEPPCVREQATHGWFEEQFHNLLAGMLHVHRNVRREVEEFPAVRAATREELYCRLHRARDFMEASLDQPLTIPQIADIAWFSPFHFLRLFKQVFGETPHQYLTRRRLEWAQMLLTQSEMPITEICVSVGFESLPSFSGLFRQRTGMSPSLYRTRHSKR